MRNFRVLALLPLLLPLLVLLMLALRVQRPLHGCASVLRISSFAPAARILANGDDRAIRKGSARLQRLVCRASALHRFTAAACCVLRVLRAARAQNVERSCRARAATSDCSS